MIKWILLTMSLLTINVANAQYKYDESVAEFLRQCQTYSNDILALSDKEMLLNVFDTISVEKSFIKKLNANIEYGITVYLKDEQEKIDIKVYKKEAGKWKDVKAKVSNDLGFQTIGFFTASATTNYNIIIKRKKRTSQKSFNYYFLEFYANYEQ
ncbi:MAG: hypothetical protein V9E96_13240 [Chitinophagaceae bacterium]|jgi:hypothetical protein